MTLQTPWREIISASAFLPRRFHARGSHTIDEPIDYLTSRCTIPVTRVHVTSVKVEKMSRNSFDAIYCENQVERSFNERHGK